MKCPCDPSFDYKDCCEKIHNDISNAKTAEQLMRSRYSAYVLVLADYLILSQHPSTRKTLNKREIEDWSASQKWVRLNILSKSKGLSTDDEGTVEFIAYFKKGIRNLKIHENSKFLKEEGVWMYVSPV